MGGKVEIVGSDNGPGIPDDIKDKGFSTLFYYQTAYSGATDPLCGERVSKHSLGYMFGLFSQTFALQFEAMCFGYDTVEDGIGNRRLIKICMPFPDREL